MAPAGRVRAWIDRALRACVRDRSAPAAATGGSTLPPRFVIPPCNVTSRLHGTSPERKRETHAALLLSPSDCPPISLLQPAARLPSHPPPLPRIASARGSHRLLQMGAPEQTRQPQIQAQIGARCIPSMLPLLLLLLLLHCACSAAVANAQAPPAASGGSASLFATVDALAGFDHNCTSITLDLSDATADPATFQPCRSVDAALALLSAAFSDGHHDHASAWLQLLPGVHATGSLNSGEMNFTLASSSPPSLPSALIDALADRSAAAAAALADSSSVLDCSGHLNCLRSGGNATLELSGLRVTGSDAHALVHLGEGAIELVDCIFDSLGGVLLKHDGRVSILRSTLSQVRSNHTALVAAGVPDAGLVHLNNSHLWMGDSVVRDCICSGPSVLHRGATFSILSRSLVHITLVRSHFLRNELRNDPVTQLVFMVGGPVLQVMSDYIDLRLVDCVFASNLIRGYRTHGGAVSLQYRVGNPAMRVRVSVEGCMFDSNACFPPLDISKAPTCVPILWPRTGATCRGNGGAIAMTPSDSETSFVAGPSLSIHRSSFHNNSGEGGGAIRGTSLFFLNITDTNFTSNEAFGGGGGALALHTSQNLAPIALWGPFVMDNVRFENNVQQGNVGGGAVYVSALLHTVTITRMTCVNNSAPIGMGGCLLSYAPSVLGIGGLTTVSILRGPLRARSLFALNSAKKGGALAASNTHLRVEYADFDSHSAVLSGGTISAEEASVVMLRGCVMRHSAIAGELPWGVKSAVRQGGAISAIGGHLTLDSCSFRNCSVLPPEGIHSCQDYYQAATASTTDYRGGAVAVGEAALQSLGNTVEDARACSGGFLFFTGRGDAASIYDSFLNLHAYAASGYAVIGGQSFLSYYNDATDCRAERVAGLYAVSSSQEMYVTDSVFRNVTVADGDGGVLWTTLIGQDGLFCTGNSFIDCGAPRGGGPILFISDPSTSKIALPIVGLVGPLANRVSYSPALPPPSLYGGLAASSFESVNVTVVEGEEGHNATERIITPDQPLRQYPGIALPHIRVYALDAYQQVMKMDRNLVIHLELIGAGASNPASLSGTVLRAIVPTTGAALFDDIVVSAGPGRFTLRLEATQLDISAVVPLEILAGCPVGLYYDRVVQQCRRCAADFLVWEPSLQSCVPCAAGWEVQTVDGAQVCRLCKLGDTSSSGGSCGICNSNTYQPFPGAECESCGLDGMEGLNCDVLLAAVEPGWFAYSAISEDEGLPRAQTAQCPEGFCAGGLFQLPWTDESLPLNGSSSTVRPLARTVITRFDQCAFPRLATESNIMCGECVEGYIPWGDKCLRFVVLYFVQTAMLEIGGATKLLGWLNIALFSPNSTGECIAPLSPYQQTQVQIVMPLLLLGELICLAGLHYLAHKRWATAAALSGSVRLSETPVGAGLPARIQARLQFAVDCYSPDLYVSAAFSLLLFTYTQVAAACLSYLSCVDVGGVSVVFSQPSMRCASDEYRSTLVLVIFALTVYVAGFPLGVFFFLLYKYPLVRGAYALLRRQAADEERMDQDQAALSASKGADQAVSSGSIDRAPTVTPVSPGDVGVSVSSSLPPPSSSSDLVAVRRFLVRFSPLFSMYSSRAWFWQLFVLARRTAFVAISVSLVRTPSLRFLAFSLSHLASMLLQLQCEPFQLSFFNRAELASHVLLLVLSMLLTAMSTPYSTRLQIGVFLLVVPPVALYAVVAARIKLRDVRSSQRAEQEEARRRQEEAEAQLYDAHHDSKPTMHPLHTHGREIDTVQPPATPQSGGDLQLAHPSHELEMSTFGASATSVGAHSRVLAAGALASDDTDHASAQL